jgi:hypothetical protein
VTGLPYPPYSVPRAELDAISPHQGEDRAEAPWTDARGLLAYLDELLATVDTQGEAAKRDDRRAVHASRHGRSRARHRARTTSCSASSA